MLTRNTCALLLLFSFSCLFPSMTEAESLHEDTVEKPAQRLRDIEDQLVRLGEEERALRDNWMEQNRALMDTRRQVLRQDEEVQQFQVRIQALLREVSELQAQKEALIQERARSEDVDPGISQESLQQDIMQLRQQRQELIQERTELMHQLESASSIGDKVEPSDNKHAPEEDTE